MGGFTNFLVPVPEICFLVMLPVAVLFCLCSGVFAFFYRCWQKKKKKLLQKRKQKAEKVKKLPELLQEPYRETSQMTEYIPEEERKKEKKTETEGSSGAWRFV